MLTFQWLLTVGALLIAGLALVRARRATKRLDRLTESYWELRFEHGQLRARVTRLDPDQPQTPAETAPQAGSTFVPLSSLRR